jgi:ubiquinone/menaquinone biosynthesis C-methylase UbiE
MSPSVTRAGWRDIWARFSGDGAYPEELSALLLIPLRRVIFSPRQLVESLELAPGAHVLEVGPGPGFFSLDVARAVPQGRLELVDLQAGMLAKARRRVRAARLGNVGFTQATATMLPFVRASFDAAFLVAVLGEVPDPSACLAAIADLLKPGGRLVCVELPGDPDALSAEQLRAFAANTSLRLAQSRRVGRAMLTWFEQTANP